jgi:hypothetical protein
MPENKIIDVPGKTWHMEITHDAENVLLIAFRGNNPHLPLTTNQKEEIIKDVEDWGKWKVFKELKRDLENET